MKYSYLFLKLYIFLSWITHTVGRMFFGMGLGDGQGANPLVRMTMGDLCGFAAIFLYIITSYQKKFYFPETLRVLFLFYLLLVPGIFITPRPFNVFMEVFILTFMGTLTVLMVNYFREKKLFYELLNLIIFTSLLAALVGFWDLLAGFTSLPHIFAPRREGLMVGEVYQEGLMGEAKSGFRNAGQAGTYFLIMVTIMFPLRYSMLYKNLTPFRQKILRISMTLSAIYLIATVKIASLLGFVVALPIYAVMFRKTRLIMGIGVFLGIVIISLPTLLAFAPKFYNRFNNKLRTRVLRHVYEEYETEDRNSKNSFIVSNYSMAYYAFKDKPLTGSGLGGFAKVYMKYEVHSTPFKLLGETGILGILGYCLFMSLFLLHFAKIWKYSRGNPYRDYLKNMIPFIIGCFINWGYSFHMRKRPFWFLVTIIIISYYLMREWERTQKLEKEKTLLLENE